MWNPFKQAPKFQSRPKVEAPLAVDQSTVERQIEIMRETNEKLRQLLERPEPGLMTWYQAVGQCLRVFKNIHDGINDGD